MIKWRRYRGNLDKLLERVGRIPQSNMSNTFLVYGGFTYSSTKKILSEHKDAYYKDRWGVHRAMIMIHSDQLSLIISGLSGTVDISHYSIINKPKSILKP